MTKSIAPLIVDSLAEPVGNVWKSFQNNTKGLFYIASPISNTPAPIYEWIITHANDFKNWRKLRFVLMDEQVKKTSSGNFAYVSLTDSANYETKIKAMFLTPLETKVNFPVSDGVIKPEITNLTAFDEEIENHGGLDLLLLAIDVNGQYAQVYPGTSIRKGFHIAKLQETYRERHTKSTGLTFSGAHFQEQGMSLGPKQVLSAKRVIIIISGSHKQKVTQQLLSYREFNPDFPLSIIYHPRVKEKVKIFLTKDVLANGI